MKDYARGILHGLLIFALIFVPAFLIGQSTTTGRQYAGTWSGWNVPSGLVFLIASGSCPAGTSQVTAMDGKMPLGTLAANGDIGTTGGADAITPAGTNGTVSFTPAGTNGTVNFTPSGTNSTVTGPAPTITWPLGVPTQAAGNFTQPTISWPAGVPTLSGTTLNAITSVINHTHTITSTLSVQGGTTAATTGTHVMTSTATGGSVRQVTSGDAIASSSANPSGGVASITPTIASQGTITWPAGVPTNAGGAFTPGAISWPVGVPTNSTTTIPAQTFVGSQGTVPAESFTGSAGTVPAQSWVGTQFDNRSAFVKVIYCQKT